MSPADTTCPNRPVTRYVPGAASTAPAGHDGDDRLRDHVTVNVTGAAAGCNVTTCVPPPGEQSSLDQTRSLPLNTLISRAACPTSRVHGTAPLFATPMVRTGRREEGYVCASAFADTTTAESGHGASAAAVVAAGEGVTDGVPNVAGEPEGAGDCRTDGVPSEPHDRASRNSASTTIPSVSSRRRQYTPGGSGPRGCTRASASIAVEPTMPTVVLADAVLDWYATAARDLPWRRTTDPWAVLVSEVMLQQTPVARVLPVYDAWLRRWPAPGLLAAEPAGEAVRMWGRLGYPRRALRLHQAATAIVERHGGAVPDDLDALLALPGVGAYTARAVASFAFGQRHAVVDTNVRRVVARAVGGLGEAGPPRTASDLAACAALLPDDPARAAAFGVALMELGALVCTARTPSCDGCPLVTTCAWWLAGRPVYEGPRQRPQPFEGTDRQARGALLAVLRDADGAVPEDRLTWPDEAQRRRALDGLVADGLAIRTAGGFALPG